MFLLTFVCQPTKRQDLTRNFHSIWFLYFVNAFQSTVFYSLSPYISSSFQAHSLSGVPMALADAFTAACYLPVGKLMDTWGRAQGFLLMTVCATLGLILFATCNSFAIYCVGYVRWPTRNSPQSLTILTIDADLLSAWLQWNGVFHRCHYGRFLYLEEPRSGVRFHLVALYYYRLCWPQGCR